MAFWDHFSTKENSNYHSVLHEKVVGLLPDSEEKELISVTCIAGLFARVAYSDMEIHDNEIESMKASLTKWTDLTEKDVAAVTTLAMQEIKNLCGIENHKYTEPLSVSLTVNQRYGILEALFSLAAADGTVGENESQEIRLVSRGLLLEHKHFIAAQATVLEYLATLR